MQTAKWPKTFPPLTAEQQRINDDFMKRWHEVLPNRYGMIEKFNHTFPARHSRPGFKTTLEIGAGLGEHVNYEKLTPEQEQNYYALELRPNMAARIKANHPRIQAIVGDCQTRLDFPDGYFDRYIAVHVLEHLPNLPACLREAYRLLNRERGQLLVVIPCEGSPAYSFARKISAQRIFEKTYGMSYDVFIKREHINLPHEILAELNPYFTVREKSFFPLPFLPFILNNLCIGLVLQPRPTPLTAD
jgi:SAM-dependent methyltransferase